MAEKNELMEKVISLAKRRGFIYPGSELYGGLANTYDYGPVGTELLRNIRTLWWKYFVLDRDDIVGLEASLISHKKVWEASGHLAGFADAMIDCKECKSRFRADHIIEDFLETHVSEDDKTALMSVPLDPDLLQKIWASKKVEGLSAEQLNEFLKNLSIPCPSCKKNTGDKWTDVRHFNQLFPVELGIIAGEGNTAYLRGETAQGMFVAFDNVINSTRVRLPFGIAQLGKSFRNEITPGNSIFRTLVFEQAEIEYFFDPEKENWETLFEAWKTSIHDFLTAKIGIDADHLRWRPHTDEERSFYSKRTEDVEYEFPFGYKELWGLAYRTDYDLKQHIKHSGKDLFIMDPQTNTKITPHVIEPAVGIDRILLMTLCDAYAEIDGRIVLKFSPQVAPYKVAVFPLLSNKPELTEKAREIYMTLKKHMPVMWDDRGNIGKRYLYQDEIGTPWCVTVDFDTLEDGAVTVRDRDTAQQERVQVADLETYFLKKLTIDSVS